MEYFSDCMKHSVHLKRKKKGQAGSKSLLLSTGTYHWILTHLQSAANCGLCFAHSYEEAVDSLCFYQAVPISIIFFICNRLCSKAEYARELH